MNLNSSKPLITKYEVINTMTLPIISGSIVSNKYGYSLRAKVAEKPYTTVLKDGRLAMTFSDIQYYPLSTKCSWEKGKIYHTAEIEVIRPMSCIQDKEGNWTEWKSNEKALTFLRVIKLY